MYSNDYDNVAKQLEDFFKQNGLKRVEVSLWDSSLSISYKYIYKYKERHGDNQVYLSFSKSNREISYSCVVEENEVCVHCIIIDGEANAFNIIKEHEFGGYLCTCEKQGIMVMCDNERNEEIAKECSDFIGSALIGNAKFIGKIIKLIKEYKSGFIIPYSNQVKEIKKIKLKIKGKEYFIDINSIEVQQKNSYNQQLKGTDLSPNQQLQLQPQSIPQTTTRSIVGSSSGKFQQNNQQQPQHNQQTQKINSTVNTFQTLQQPQQSTSQMFTDNSVQQSTSIIQTSQPVAQSIGFNQQFQQHPAPVYRQSNVILPQLQQQPQPQTSQSVNFNQFPSLQQQQNLPPKPTENMIFRQQQYGSSNRQPITSLSTIGFNQQSQPQPAPVYRQLCGVSQQQNVYSQPAQQCQYYQQQNLYSQTPTYQQSLQQNSYSQPQYNPLQQYRPQLAISNNHFNPNQPQLQQQYQQHSQQLNCASSRLQYQQCNAAGCGFNQFPLYQQQPQQQQYGFNNQPPLNQNQTCFGYR